MTTLPLFLIKSRRYLELGQATAGAPRFGGRMTECVGFPLMIGAFVLTALLALAQNA